MPSYWTIAGATDAPQQMRQDVIVPPYGDEASPDAVAIDLADEDILNSEIPIVAGELTVPPTMMMEHAEEIALVLGTYAADQPNLTAEKDGLANGVAAALVNLGCKVDAEQVRIISCAPISRFAGLMPAEAGRDLASRFGADLANVIGKHTALSMADMLNTRLGAELVEAIGHDACRDLGDAIMQTVTKPLLQRKTSVGDDLGELLWKSYHEALRFQIGFTLAGLKAERGLVSPFLELYTYGNFPIGYLEDDSFLVMVA